MQESVLLRAEHPPRFILVDPALPVNELQQSAALDVFHDDGQVRRRVEDLHKGGTPSQLSCNISGVLLHLM